MKDIIQSTLAQVLTRTPEGKKTLMRHSLKVESRFFTSVLRDDLYQLVSFLWLYLQVVLRHGSRNYSWSLVLIG